MPKRSKTGVTGLRLSRGRYVIDLRHRDAKTGKSVRVSRMVPLGAPLAAAKKYAQDLHASLLAGTYNPNVERTKRLSEMFDEYIGWLGTNVPRSARDRSYHADTIVRSIGDMPITDLSAWHVERLKKALKERGVANATVNRHLATLKHMAAIAEQHNRIGAEQANAIRKVRKLREPPGRVRWLSDDERERLFASMPEHLRAIVVLALTTGARLGELRSLRWAQIDLARKEMRIVKSKSNRSRTVPLNDQAAHAFTLLHEKTGHGEHVFLTRTYAAYSERSTSLSKQFKLATERAKIIDLRFHDLRHDFATKLVRENAGIDAIAKLLGHATIQMTTRYAHLGDEQLREAVGKVGSRLPVAAAV